MQGAVIESVVLHVSLRIFRCAEEWSHVVVWGTGQRFRVARADKNKEKL